MEHPRHHFVADLERRKKFSCQSFCIKISFQKFLLSDADRNSKKFKRISTLFGKQLKTLSFKNVRLPEALSLNQTKIEIKTRRSQPESAFIESSVDIVLRLSSAVAISTKQLSWEFRPTFSNI